MNTQALETLAAHLLTLGSDTAFDLAMWKQVRSCGTTACAVGEACTLPYFANKGLTLREGIFRSQFPVLERRNMPTLTRWEAVEAVFEITREQAEFLFHASSYPERATPAMVAIRIKAFYADPDFNPDPH